MSKLASSVSHQKPISLTYRYSSRYKPGDIAESFLVRLCRVLRLRRDNTEGYSDDGLKFMDWTIFRSLIDCINNGKKDESLALIKEHRLLEARNSELARQWRLKEARERLLEEIAQEELTST